MATINISDLHPTGSDLFSDSESYINELGDAELDATYGGSTPIIWSVRASVVLTIAAVTLFTNQGEAN